MRNRRRHIATALLAGLLLWGGGGGAEPLYAQNERNPVGEFQQKFEADSTRPLSSADLVSVDLRPAARPHWHCSTLESAGHGSAASRRWPHIDGSS